MDLGKRYRFTEDNVDKAPDEHGVYVLYERDELRGDEGRCTAGATYYRRVVREDGKTLEADLLADYKRRHGRRPRCNEVMP